MLSLPEMKLASYLSLLAHIPRSVLPRLPKIEDKQGGKQVTRVFMILHILHQLLPMLPRPRLLHKLLPPRLFFKHQSLKATGGRTREGKVSGDDLQSQSTMGESGGWGGHQHHDRRFPVGILDLSGTESGPSSTRHHEGSSFKSDFDFSSQMVRNWCSKGNKNEDSTLVFTSLHQGQKERQVTTSDIVGTGNTGPFSIELRVEVIWIV